jgi:hypothetical protein
MFIVERLIIEKRYRGRRVEGLKGRRVEGLKGRRGYPPDLIMA